MSGTGATAPRIVLAEEVPPQPWRNGGGQTRELLAWPPGGDWRLRISLADIREPGPFSAFPGVTRWFTVIEGDGVVLEFPDREEHLALGSAPLRFDGALAPHCRLLASATRDLNLMHRDGRAVMLPLEPGELWPGGFPLRGLFTVVPGQLMQETSAPVPLPAFALWWQSEAPGGALCFEPDAAAGKAGVGWWLGYEPG